MRRGLARRDGDRGSTTVLTLGIASAALVAAIVLAGLTQAHVANTHAQAVADLAVLAGAADAVRGASGCPAAAALADRHSAELVACEEEGGFVQLRLRARHRLILLGWTAVTAQARAGPVR